MAMKTNAPRPAQVSDAIEQGYDTLDDTRAAALGGLLRIREAKARTLERRIEQSQTAGRKDAAREYAAIAESNAQLVQLLTSELALAETPQPKPDPNAATVHGYVWERSDTQVAPMASARVGVTAADTGKKLAETKTNRKGYFKVKVPVAEKSTAASVSVLGPGKPSSPAAVALSPSSVSFHELTVPGEPPKAARKPRPKRRIEKKTKRRR